MAEDVSPTVARRRLRLALRAAREGADLTQQEVAERMEWSASKVIRIESGDVTIAPNDLRPLLDYLGVKDKSVIASLVADAATARRRQPQAWYQAMEFREHLSDSSRRLLEYEADATAVRYYYVNFVAGPLQTPEYAAALMARYEEEFSADQIAVRLQARIKRREKLLARAAAGEIDVRLLVDESVFLRTIGGPAVFAAQLRELAGLARGGVIKLRFVPFDASTAVTNNASFDLLTLAGAGEVLYRETGIRDEIVEDQATTARHRERYDLVWQEVPDEADTIDFIRKRIEHLDAATAGRRGDPE